MHPITFQFKRAHLSIVAFGKKMFRGTLEPDDPDFDGVLDMTPARFDILKVIHGRGAQFLGTRPPRCAPMREIRRKLGLSPATISVACARLEQLGLVTCERDSVDKRNVIVRLTDEGVRRIRRAFDLVFTQHRIADRVRSFSWPRGPGRGRRSRLRNALDAFWWRSRDFADHFGDRSADVYTFAWDDDH